MDSFPGAFNLGTLTITGAGELTTPWRVGFQGCVGLSIQCRFDYGGGAPQGAALLFIQTSLDSADHTPSGTAVDIACLLFGQVSKTEVRNFTNEALLEADSDGGGFEPTDGGLAVGQVVNGLLGDRFRIKVITDTIVPYSGSTQLSVSGVAR